MASLTPGVLVKLLQHMNSESDVRVVLAGEHRHRSVVLQVMSIVPALEGGNCKDLCPNHGFYLKVSDSSQATYVSLPEDHHDLIFTDKLQLGQFIHVVKLESGSPYPILRGVRLIPRRHPCVGNPEDIPAPAWKSDYSDLRWKVDFSYSEHFKRSSVEEAGRSKVRSSSAARSATLTKKAEACRDERSTAGNKEGEEMKSCKGRSASTDGKRSNNTEAEAKTLRRSWEGLKRPGDKPTFKPVNVNTKPIPMNKKLSGFTEPSQKTCNVGSSPLKVRTGSTNSGSINSPSKKMSSCNTSPSKKTCAPSSDGSVSCNLVKASVNSKRWTDGSISWDSLPSSFIAAGKEALQRRDSALLAAVEALQEASAAESVVRCLSMFAELCSSAKKDDPQPSVEHFLDLHARLRRAVLLADGLAKTKSCRAASPDDKNNITSAIEACNVSSERRKSANSWIRAALATDLSSFSLLRKQATTVHGYKEPGKENPVSNQLFLVLDNSSKPLAVKGHNSSSSSKKVSPPSKILGNREKKNSSSNDCEAGQTKTSLKSIRSGNSNETTVKNAGGRNLKKKCQDQPPKDLPPSKWVKGKGLDETADLAKQMMCESQKWFLNFMEGALDSGFQDIAGSESAVDNAGTKTSAQADSCQVACMLSQLKRVNDWLEETGSQKGLIDGGKQEEFTDPELAKTLTTVRQKIYEFLLQHVEYAAYALGCQSVAVQSKGASANLAVT